MGSGLVSHGEASSRQSVGELAKRRPAKTDPRLPSAGHRLLVETPICPTHNNSYELSKPPRYSATLIATGGRFNCPHFADRETEPL